MRLLVVHAWLKGNLGDVLQASVLLRALRELGPSTLDLAAYPASPGAHAGELLALADRCLPEHFAWYWRYTPSAARSLLLSPYWRRRRAQLFSRYDAVLSAPGPFLAEYDARAPSALADLEAAEEAGVPMLLSSHSIGPLPERDLAVVRRAALRVAREEATHAYLERHGLRSVRAADLAFLYPYEQHLGKTRAASVGRRYRLLFLRSNNLRGASLHQGHLECGGTRIELEPNERVILATSDSRRDARFLTKLSRKLGVTWVAPRSVADLVNLVAGSSGIISDRYHPAICGKVLGKPTEVIMNREPHKMGGLAALLKQNDVSALKALAQGGLDAVIGTLRGAPRARERKLA